MVKTLMLITWKIDLYGQHNVEISYHISICILLDTIMKQINIYPVLAFGWWKTKFFGSSIIFVAVYCNSWVLFKLFIARVDRRSNNRKQYWDNRAPQPWQRSPRWGRRRDSHAERAITLNYSTYTIWLNFVRTTNWLRTATFLRLSASKKWNWQENGEGDAYVTIIAPTLIGQWTTEEGRWKVS